RRSAEVSRLLPPLSTKLFVMLSKNLDRSFLHIPQANPRAGYLAQQSEIDAAVSRVLEGGSYILGREVEIFESAFAAFVGAAYAVGVGNGTDAIELALRACGIGSGDLVFPLLPPA